MNIDNSSMAIAVFFTFSLFVLNQGDIKKLLQKLLG